MAARARAPAHPALNLAQEKWESSGLNNDHARKLRFQPLTGEEVQALHPKFHPVPSLKIPYFDLAGKETGFYRIRYLGRLPGFAGTVEKPQKYAQAPGTINEVYLPPLLERSWKEIAKDVKTPIVITEGELKAAAGCSIGLAVVGLGGVEVWRSARRGIALLSPLDEFEFKDRDCTIVFDSDASHNPTVAAAQRRLAAFLVHRGARVAIASIPARAEAAAGGDQRGGGPAQLAKVGLDDLLVGSGPGAVLAVIESAIPYEEGSALWGMNEEFLYVNDPGLVIERDNGRTMEPSKFAAHHYSNRFFLEQVTTKTGGITFKKKALARHWLDWEHRAEARRLVYEPGKGRLLPDGSWNTWQGWGVEPRKGDVSPWLWLLDFLFKGDPAARQWFERWCAYPLQHPGVKLYSSCLLWSVKHGMGKGLVEYMLASIYGRNSIEIDSQALRGSFNAWAARRQFVIGNEITAGEARLDKDKLKGMITRRDITINEKYMPEYTIRDCVNYIFDSNSPDALFVEDNDRRYFVREVIGDPADQAFYDRCDSFLKGEGPSYLFDHLLKLDLGDFRPLGHAHVTADKRAMIINGKSDLAYWVAMLRDDPKTMLKPLGEKAADGCDLFTTSQLLRCYDPENTKRVTAPGMGRELQRAGFHQMNTNTPVWTTAGALRLYAVRNITKWMAASATDLRRHFERFFGEVKFQ